MVSAQGQLEMEVKFIREDMNLSFIIWLVCEVGFRGRDKFIHEGMNLTFIMWLLHGEKGSSTRILFPITWFVHEVSCRECSALRCLRVSFFSCAL